MRNWRGFLALGLIISVSAIAASADSDSDAPPTANGTSITESGALPVSHRVARREMQALLDQGLNLLVKELVEQGTFYPFALIMGHDGEIRAMGVPADQRSDSAEVTVERLLSKCRELADQQRIQAVGFFMDYAASRADTGFPQPGIRVELNHISPDAISVFVPYQVTRDQQLRLLTPQYKNTLNRVFEGPNI